MMPPTAALEALTTAPLIRLENVPRNVPGLYLLHDHEQVPRYVGKTMNLWHRVWSNHCAGDENSHKFVAAYNAGRLWHSRKNALSDAGDGKVAKELRKLLAREFCRARALPLPTISEYDLGVLEDRVRAIAPEPINDWNDIKQIPTMEPVELVDRLLDQIGWTADQRAKLDRQAARWATWKTGERAAA